MNVISRVIAVIGGVLFSQREHVTQWRMKFIFVELFLLG